MTSKDQRKELHFNFIFLIYKSQDYCEPKIDIFHLLTDPGSSMFWSLSVSDLLVIFSFSSPFHNKQYLFIQIQFNSISKIDVLNWLSCSDIIIIYSFIQQKEQNSRWLSPHWIPLLFSFRLSSEFLISNDANFASN